ncbi:MAG: thiamine phosphate synthase [Candidatus Cloacimonadia bacterium]|jgi:thiamine-phosphate pyrophosphorylase
MSQPLKGSLYLVTDSSLTRNRSLDEIVYQSVKGGVNIVQLREKGLNERDFVAMAKRIKALLEPFNVPLIINDRVDVALASSADGVHLGQSDMPYSDARRLLGEDKIIGLSVESFEQVVEAEELDVDYIALSPIYSTPTKPDTITEWGIERLKKVRSISRHPIVAIGGINRQNITQIVEAGADIIAVVSAICSAESPYDSAKELKQLINKPLKEALILNIQ